MLELCDPRCAHSRRALPLGQNEDEGLINENIDETRSDQQRFSNGGRLSSNAFETHRGDDFYKKLMFYEKNAASNNANNNNNNGYHQTTSSPRRTSFQQSSLNPSMSKSSSSFVTRQAQHLGSRPNFSANPFNKQSTMTSNLADRMQRSKSYKDLFESPSSASSTNIHHIYYQATPTGNRSGHNLNSSSANNNLYPYYSSSFYYQNNNGPNPNSTTSIVGSMFGNSSSNGNIDQHAHLSSTSDYPRRQLPMQHATSTSNLLLDEVSSSSTVSHLPKPPPGIPSQNAR